MSFAESAVIIVRVVELALDLDRTFADGHVAVVLQACLWPLYTRSSAFVVLSACGAAMERHRRERHKVGHESQPSVLRLVRLANRRARA